jgi:hypothetical protein
VPERPGPWVLLALLLLGVGLAFWRPVPAGIWHDDGVYLIIGQALSEGRGLVYAGVPGDLPAVKFPPGYPAVLAALWTIFGSLRAVTLAAVFLNLALLAAAGALLGFSLHRSRVLSRRASLAVGGLAFVSADVWRPALVPLSEAVFVALLVGSLAAWGWASLRHDRKGALTLAVLLSAAILTRSAAVAVVAGFAVALGRSRGVRVAVLVSAPAIVLAGSWGWWASTRVDRIPEGLRDVLGPYGSWLSAQLLGAPAAYLKQLPAHGVAVLERLTALIAPGLSGPWLWTAAIPLLLLGLHGARLLSRRLPPLPWVLGLYLGMLLFWPYVDRRLVAPAQPLAVVCVAVGVSELWRRRGRLGRVALVVGSAWAILLTTVSASRAARGWAVAGYELRAGRLAVAVETLRQTAPAGAVVGAPEFWAGLHLHGGWRTVPSARFTPRAEDEAVPVWGSPAEQLEIWWLAGVDHVLLEQGGLIHGEALNRLEEACPGAVTVLARMPPQMLVRVVWDDACARSLGVDGGS